MFVDNQIEVSVFIRGAEILTQILKGPFALGSRQRNATRPDNGELWLAPADDLTIG